jgi:hypothetical protein
VPLIGPVKEVQKKEDKTEGGHFVREKHVASIFSFGEVLV